MLVITNWRDLDHPEAGGAEVVCQELARRLASSGTDVVLLCAAVRGKPPVERRDGYTIVRSGGRFTVYLMALLWLVRHRSEVTAVIDSQNGIPFFTPLAVRRSTPLVMLLHHIHQEQFAKYFPAPAAMLGRFLESTGSRLVYGRRGIVAVSPSTRHGARRSLGLAGDIWVIPPGWAVTEEVRREGPHRTDHPSIVCVGRLVPHKRLDLVMNAFPRVLQAHPDATLTIVGRGTEIGRLRSLAHIAGVAGRITFHTDLDDVSRDRLMATAWMTVNASQGEGWGLSVLEANALGIPALAYRRPGLRDSIVPGETGWLIEDDADLGVAMADCLTELMDLGRARELTQRTRRWAATFTWDRMAQRVADALASERARLSYNASDRRASSDVATVVDVAADLLPPGWTEGLRQGDAWELASDRLTLLLRGADTQCVPVVLRRMGLPEEVITGNGLTARVARTSDLLRLANRSKYAVL